VPDLQDAIILSAEYRPGKPPRASVRCRRFLHLERYTPVYGGEEIVPLEGDEARAFVREHMHSGARWA
jgi:hypothetical protein